jgi:hypothetical protein
MSKFQVLAALIIALFFVMIALIIVGRWLGIRQRSLDMEGAKAGVGTVDAAVFSLLGLLIAFTFGGAASRYDAKRQLIAREANAIGTAYLRIDLLPPSAQPGLREDFRSYLDARIGFFRNLSANQYVSKQEVERYAVLQNKIWTEAMAGCREANSPATTSLVVSSLNEMFDITTTRLAALETHPPRVIFVGLVVLMLAGALLTGYGMADGKKPSKFHVLVFPLILTTAMFVIVDIEYPRIGLVRIDTADHFLTDLRATMK